MKTGDLAASTAIAMTALLHAASFATQPSASTSGNVAAHSSVGGGFSLGTKGSATSYAQNSQAVTAQITAARSYTPNYGAVNAGISGATTTESAGKAYNISTGSGSG